MCNGTLLRSFPYPSQPLCKSFRPNFRQTDLRIKKTKLSQLRAESVRKEPAEAEEAFELPKVQRAVSSKACCYGCGINIQTENSNAAGFVELHRYEEKLTHRQLDQLLCKRCQELSHGKMIPAVEDQWALRQQYGSRERPLLTPQQLREQLTVIREKAALVILLVDLLDASGSFLSRLRDLTGRNPIVLVGTKVDLLPQGTDESAVEVWLADMAAAKKVNVIHTCLVSSRTRAGVPEATAFIRQNRRGRDVYIVGAANVGKSAFSRALMESMSDALSRQFDPAAAAKVRRLPVQSAMPGTTLQFIPLKAFQTGGCLIDTPGLHLHHRIIHMLTPEEARDLHPRGRLKPYVAPPLAQESSLDARKGYAGTYRWGGVIEIGVSCTSDTCRVVFYGAQSLKAQLIPDPKSEKGPEMPSSGFGAVSVAGQGGLRIAKEARLRASFVTSAVADIAVSGLPGWISLISGEGSDIDIKVWAPVGVEVYLRPPIPCPNPVIDL